MGSLLQILGILCLMGRIWLVEYKLKEELDNKRFHISRFCSYYFFIGMMLDFQHNPFTLISIVAMPAMIIAFFVFDLPFYYNDLIKKKSSYDSKTLAWLVVERLTLHLPLIIYSFYFYFFSHSSLGFYFKLFEYPNLIIALILVVPPFLLFDPRWKKKKETPRGGIIFFAIFLTTIGTIIFVMNYASKYHYNPFIINR